MPTNNNPLIIVESPVKARTIKKFLDKNCIILACMGHVRDLPRKAAEIPPEIKKESWSSLGVNIENNFKPIYITPHQKTKTINEIRRAMKDASSLYLATDEDREGESISWHLVSILKPKIPTKRMVFHEITGKAIQHAFENPRDLNMKLVHAQETRRILDRLVGYTLSPLLWKKIAYGLSAGRVQSTALRALVELEKKRMVFKKANYWGVRNKMKKGKSEFEAKLQSFDGKKIALGKDFDETTGKLKKTTGKGEIILLDKKTADSIQKEAKDASFTVKKVEEKPLTRKPSPPFITSTLQQEASRKIGMSAQETMRVAQSLYEKGFITYMRTDSITLSDSAITASRKCVQKLFTKDFLNPSSRVFKGKSKGAQEAHEAIRPSLNFTPPSEIKLKGRELELYELIWMRTVATQMRDAKQMQVSVTIEMNAKGKPQFYASGMKIIFPGFLKAYVEGEDDQESAIHMRERLLPNLKERDTLECVHATSTHHETKPPARYTEATLIQTMEKEGIGRPSTYASVIETLSNRRYMKKQKNALIPSFTGVAVTDFMKKYFTNLVDFSFTSKMEDSLDQIAKGKLKHIPYLKEFYLGEHGLQEKVKKEEESISAIEARSVILNHIKNLDIKIGKYGPYFEYKDSKTGELIRGSIPENLAPSDLTESSVDKLIEQTKEGPTSLAKDPETKKDIFLRTGAYGHYLQLGDLPDEKTGKLKRVSLPKNIDPENIDKKTAIAIINLPRKIGVHPELKKDIVTNIGRFGPYVMCDGDFRSLKKEDNIITIDLKRALELLSAPKKQRRGSVALRTIGNHSKTKEKIEVFNGPYGPYIKYDKKNISIPKKLDYEKMTLVEAEKLIDEKHGLKKVKAKGGRKKTTSKKKSSAIAKTVKKVIRRKAKTKSE